MSLISKRLLPNRCSDMREDELLRVGVHLVLVLEFIAAPAAADDDVVVVVFN